MFYNASYMRVFQKGRGEQHCTAFHNPLPKVTFVLKLIHNLYYKLYNQYSYNTNTSYCFSGTGMTVFGPHRILAAEWKNPPAHGNLAKPCPTHTHLRH